MQVPSLWAATCLAQNKSERARTGRAGSSGERIPPTTHLFLSCLISREILLLWRVVPPTSSLQTALKQPSLPQKKQPGREMLLSWAAPIRSINTYQPGLLMNCGYISSLSPSVLGHVSLREFPISNLNLLQ